MPRTDHVHQLCFKWHSFEWQSCRCEVGKPERQKGPGVPVPHILILVVLSSKPEGSWCHAAFVNFHVGKTVREFGAVVVCPGSGVLQRWKSEDQMHQQNQTRFVSNMSVHLKLPYYYWSRPPNTSVGRQGTSHLQDAEISVIALDRKREESKVPRLQAFTKSWLIRRGRKSRLSCYDAEIQHSSRDKHSAAPAPTHRQPSRPGLCATLSA